MDEDEIRSEYGPIRASSFEPVTITYNVADVDVETMALLMGGQTTRPSDPVPHVSVTAETVEHRPDRRRLPTRRRDVHLWLAYAASWTRWRLRGRPTTPHTTRIVLPRVALGPSEVAPDGSLRVGGTVLSPNPEVWPFKVDQ